jgi:hypothetical protein
VTQPGRIRSLPLSPNDPINFQDSADLKSYSVLRDLPDLGHWKLCVESVEHLEHLIDRLTPFGMTSTSIVLSTVVARRSIDPTMLDWRPRLKSGRRAQALK